jgi:hypothetical protein
MEKGGILGKIEKEVLFPFHFRQGEKTNPSQIHVLKGGRICDAFSYFVLLSAWL